MPKNWSNKIINEKKLVYYLRHRPSEGRPCYFFILVDPKKEKALLSHIDSDVTFDLKEYGEIIDSGFGEEAPAQVIEWVTKWYDK